MPALPSLLNYRSQLKGKVALKSPFSKRVVDSPNLAAHIPPLPVPQASHSQEVLDISDPRRSESLDFCDTSPSFEQHLYGETHTNRLPAPRPQLELNFSSDAEGLSDWFSSSFPRPHPSPKPVKGADDNKDSQDEYDSDILGEGEVFEGSIEDIPSGDVIANLEAMNASSFGRLRPESIAPPVPSKESPGRLKIPRRPPPPPPDEDSFKNSPLSSAVSGTTIARQLIANGFSFIHDPRASRHRSTLVGLTRSDSTTLPRREFEEDRFQVDPNAPPVPFNAEALYVAPKNPREPAAEAPSSSPAKTLKRRSSTGSIAIPEYDPTSPKSPTRPSSALVSPADFLSAFPLLPLGQTSAAPGLSFNSSITPLPPLPEKRNIPPAINLPGTGSTTSPAPSLASTAGSPRNIEEVLDYYSDSPEQDVDIMPPLARGYRPMFTPITEESLSQLSPPAPYSKGDRRDSQRQLPLGARNPSSPGRARSALSPQRSASDSPSILAALHSRPVSNMFTASSTSLASSASGSRANASQASINNLNEGLAPPPASGNVFNRQRAGSAPGPIQVIHDDEEDLTNYKMTGFDETPDSGDSASQDEQTFPETATAPWSAAFSPATPTVNAHSTLGEYPKTADPLTSSFKPPGDQHILLTRAASSARARHSRQVSLGISRGQAQQSGSSLATESIEEVKEPDQGSRKGSESDIKLVPPQRHPPPFRSLPPSPDGGRSPPSQTPLQLQDSVSALQLDNTPPSANAAPVARTPSSATSDRSTDSASTSAHVSQSSGRPSPKSLPLVPPSPAPPTSSSPPPAADRGARNRTPQPLQLSEAAATPLPIVAENPCSPNPEATVSNSTPPPEEESQPQNDSSSLPLQSSHSRKSTNTIDEILRASTTLGSPPPYYTVVDQLQAQQAQPPQPQQHFVPGVPVVSNLQPTVVTPSFTNPFPQAQGRDSTLPGGRARPRPAGPLGPRRPTLQNIASPGPLQLSTSRDRSGSSASLVRQASTSAGSSSRLVPPRELPTPKSPRFPVPPVKYRGYTMEAAKWTFTSSQLQSIVSRAIRDSAQTGAIRLLKLDNLDNDIPEEIHRLEMLRTDLKSKYKALAKRRATLFESLTFQLTSAGDENSTFALRVVEDISSIALSLDQLAEELHSADMELAQLNSIVQIHSSSALSMALRKLNASFLKQVAETQELQERVSTLEVEREEGWKYAEEIAQECEHLHLQPHHPLKLDSPSSKRSSRVSAKRKSSLRATKAGLRSAATSRRQSARSSVGSSVFSSHTPLSSRSPFRAEVIPPLPPIPRRRPADIVTDYTSPLRSSGALSPEGITPNSETRAMVRAEEELYSMLGLSVPDSGVKRSRSLVGLPSAGLSPPPLSSRPALQRRSSLPGEATLIEAQNAMVADRNAVVFTFEMLELRDVPEDNPHSGFGPFPRF